MFGTTQSMWQHLQQALGVTPTAYRRPFRAGDDGIGSGRTGSGGAESYGGVGSRR
ncbi:hypothetical protein [Streptomyces sp. PSAA01]|uniref:hypothetical protein n=1 Tax=Streptomyces sp. PSAA01 TaxID=2912762 RepID=UPI0035ABC141